MIEDHRPIDPANLGLNGSLETVLLVAGLPDNVSIVIDEMDRDALVEVLSAQTLPCKLERYSIPRGTTIGTEKRKAIAEIDIARIWQRPRDEIL